jgi:hypothetical protein
MTGLYHRNYVITALCTTVVSYSQSVWPQRRPCHVFVSTFATQLHAIQHVQRPGKSLVCCSRVLGFASLRMSRNISSYKLQQ